MSCLCYRIAVPLLQRSTENGNILNGESKLALVIHQKPKKTLKEITNDLCPVWATTLTCYDVLSIQQLYRISTMYWDDKYGTHSVSSEVRLEFSLLMWSDYHLNIYLLHFRSFQV
ncbi:hypothetical protein BHM03_00006894 [Ensete ventricosum]|nr:hypothetical protein BHM03_00006894 [Ensete ventricosum]